MSKKPEELKVLHITNNPDGINTTTARLIKKASIALGSCGASCTEASEALVRLSRMCHKIKLIEIDYNGLERRVLDSMTIGSMTIGSMTIGPGTLKAWAEQYYAESGIISKKIYKELLKKLNKAEKVSYKQDQTDRWCNKWDKKIKRKL